MYAITSRHQSPVKSVLVPEKMSDAIDTPQLITGNTAAGVWVSARYGALNALTDPKAGYGKHPAQMLIPKRIREGQNDPRLNAHEQAYLRDDLAEMRLKMLRDQAYRELLSLVNLKRGYVRGYDDWETAQKYFKQPGAYLWVSGVGRPPEFATLLHQSSEESIPRKVPVHNLEVLLGKEKLYSLSAVSTSFKKPIIVIRYRHRTKDVATTLWELQCFLAEHKNFLPELCSS